MIDMIIDLITEQIISTKIMVRDTETEVWVENTIGPGLGTGATEEIILEIGMAMAKTEVWTENKGPGLFQEIGK